MHHHLSAFHWDTDIGVYLFPGLQIKGPTALFLLSLVLILLSIAYEAIKVLQTQSRARAARERIRTPSCAASETSNLISASQGNRLRMPFSKKFQTLFLQAMVFMFQTTLGYILMLSVMVYNGYIFLVVVLAMGLGYFLFGHISMRINMENMRARTTNVICSTACPPGQPSTSSTKHTRTGYSNEVASDSSSCSDNNSACDNPSAQSCTVDVTPACHSTTNIIDSCRL